jgi:hypothetical protein
MHDLKMYKNNIRNIKNKSIKKRYFSKLKMENKPTNFDKITGKEFIIL